jgi:hypothetical protein
MAIEHLTVQQLIELLRQYPDDLPVVVQSYEDGYDPVTDVRTLTVAQTPNREWWLGIYEQADADGMQVILLSSKYNRAEADEADNS